MTRRAQIRDTANRLLEHAATRAEQLRERVSDTAEALRESARDHAGKLVVLAEVKTSRLLEEAADGSRDVGAALQNDVGGHLHKAKKHLADYATHEAVAAKTRQPAPPESEEARQASSAIWRTPL